MHVPKHERIVTSSHVRTGVLNTAFTPQTIHLVYMLRPL